MLTIGFAVADGSAAALAVGARPPDVLLPSAQAADAGGMIGRVLAGQHRFAGEDDDVLPICTPDGWRILVGMGEAADQDSRRLRRIGGNLFAELADSGIEHLTVALDLSAAEAAEVAYGMCLRAWRPPARDKTKIDPDEAWSLGSATLVTSDPAAAAQCFAALVGRVEAAHWVRDLVVAPANALSPERFAGCLGRLRSLGVDCEVYEPAALGLGLLDAVGRGAENPPRFAVLRWTAAGQAAPVVLVGKGITFDSGGVNIKPAEDLAEMKGDMAGAAAVAGALYALAKRRAPVNVVGLLALAENMPSGRACRPGDVVVGHAGLSVEIVDTDAEGRLILADALSYAARHCEPQLIIDLATLTGAVEVALGRHRAGLFCPDDALAARLVALGDAEDEPLWRLPIAPADDEALKSAIADLRNCQWADGPDASHAAAFLRCFVPEDIPWAHLDIAGLSEAGEDGPLSAEGPTGFGVRLLERLVAEVFTG